MSFHRTIIIIQDMLIIFWLISLGRTKWYSCLLEFHYLLFHTSKLTLLKLISDFDTYYKNSFKYTCKILY